MSGSAFSISKKGKKSGPRVLSEYMPDLEEDTSFQLPKENIPAETPGGSSKSGAARPKPKEENVPAETLGGSLKSGSTRPKPKEENVSAETLGRSSKGGSVQPKPKKERRGHKCIAS